MSIARLQAAAAEPAAAALNWAVVRDLTPSRSARIQPIRGNVVLSYDFSSVPPRQARRSSEPIELI